jgi:uncharacterized membrane protein
MSLFYFSVCFFGWGVAVFLMTIIGKNLEHRTTLVCNLIGYLLVNLFVIPKVKWGWSFHHGLAILVGVLFVISNLAYYQLSKLGGQASVLAPLTGLYVLVPVVLGWLVLGEPPTLRKWFGLVLALAAIWLLSTPGAPAPDVGGE